MLIQEVLRTIDETGGQYPFHITFTKENGHLREMIAFKRTKSRIPGSRKAPQGSAFKYQLNLKGVLLVNEVDIRPSIEKTDIGTIERVPANSRYEGLPSNSKSVKIFSIIKFNNQPVTHE